MERVAREHADSRRKAEQKADRLAAQVQQLYAELQRKDREIATVRRAKLDVEQRWRAAEVERARASVGKGAPADDLEAVIQAVAMAADAGPRFQDELRQFVHDKREERRIALVRDKIRNENPFALKQTTASREEILQRVRDCVYRKGREIRAVFRIIDEDKSGEVTSAQRYALLRSKCMHLICASCRSQLTHQEFREGLERCGAVLTDDEFAVLVKVVDYNNNGTIEYVEFAESMKVNDVQVGSSTLPHLAAAILTRAIRPDVVPAITCTLC